MHKPQPALVPAGHYSSTQPDKQIKTQLAITQTEMEQILKAVLEAGKSFNTKLQELA